MTPDRELQSPAAPSVARLVRTTVFALVMALALLVALVLPAEYGIDPVGIGGRLGLTEIAAPTAQAEVPIAQDGAPLAPAQNGPIGAYPREFTVDVFDFVLQPYEYLEYKYQMEKGATMLFAWTADHDVQHDMHGARAAGATDGPPEESFDNTTRRQAIGTYAAPFSGLHGWFWENPGAEPIKIHLATSGFYTSAVEIHSNRTRYPHTPRLLVAEPAESPAAPTIPNSR